MSSLQTILGGGAFTQGNINAINSNFAALQNIDVWVRPQYGSNSGNGSVKYPHGSYNNAYATMAGVASALRPGLVIGLQGVLFENYVAPAINDITIVGVANQPRQATDSGVANGGGATWLNPGTVASALVDIGNYTQDKPSQAWRFQNIFFNNAGDAPCVTLRRKLTGADSSHASFYGCRMSGADSGIHSIEASFVTVVGCDFYNFTGSTDCAIESVAGDGVALPLQWTIDGNRFFNNYAHIVAPLSSGTVTNNIFGWKGSSVTSTVQVHLDGGGKNNVVMKNMFQMAESTGTATMFGGGTDDGWFNNYADGAVSGVPI